MLKRLILSVVTVALLYGAGYLLFQNVDSRSFRVEEGVDDLYYASLDQSEAGMKARMNRLSGEQWLGQAEALRGSAFDKDKTWSDGEVVEWGTNYAASLDELKRARETAEHQFPHLQKTIAKSETLIAYWTGYEHRKFPEQLKRMADSNAEGKAELVVLDKFLKQSSGFVFSKEWRTVDPKQWDALSKAVDNVRGTMVNIDKVTALLDAAADGSAEQKRYASELSVLCRVLTDYSSDLSYRAYCLKHDGPKVVALLMDNCRIDGDDAGLLKQLCERTEGAIERVHSAAKKLCADAEAKAKAGLQRVKATK